METADLRDSYNPSKLWGLIHGLRGKSSNRKIEEKIEREAVTIMSAPVYRVSYGQSISAVAPA